MAAKKWPKWAAGIASVLSFTGFLYMTQRESPDAIASEAPRHGFGDAVRPNAFADGYGTMDRLPGNWEGEIFVFEDESFRRMLNWPNERKSDRERLLESLNWEMGPDAEITLPPPADPADQYLQDRPRSQLKTRRS